MSGLLAVGYWLLAIGYWLLTFKGLISGRRSVSRLSPLNIDVGSERQKNTLVFFIIIVKEASS